MTKKNRNKKMKTIKQVKDEAVESGYSADYIESNEPPNEDYFGTFDIVIMLIVAAVFLWMLWQMASLVFAG